MLDYLGNVGLSRNGLDPSRQFTAALIKCQGPTVHAPQLRVAYSSHTASFTWPAMVACIQSASLTKLRSPEVEVKVSLLFHIRHRYLDPSLFLQHPTLLTTEDGA